MARGKKREYDDDDGRTIVNMNVDGMPWYVPEHDDTPPPSPDSYKMTKEESRQYTWAAVKAGLLVVLVFAVVFGLFIAFCDFFWFK